MSARADQFTAILAEIEADQVAVDKAGYEGPAVSKWRLTLAKLADFALFHRETILAGLRAQVVQTSDRIAPCPFCHAPLKRTIGFNPYGRCETPLCWMAERQISVALDDAKQVASWNRRGHADHLGETA